MSKMKIAGFRTLTTLVFMLLSVPMMASCSDLHQIGGRTADIAFPDPKLAELAKAACRGDGAAVERYVQNGADPNGEGMDKFTVLGWAVSCQNVAGVEALLKAGSDPNKAMGGVYNAVTMAAQYPNTEVLKILLKHGGDPNSKTSNGESALDSASMYCSNTGDWSNFFTLLDSGADLNLAWSNGYDIVSGAAYEDHWRVVEALLNRGYKRELGSILKIAETSKVTDKDENEHRLKVIERLKSQGVVADERR